MKNMIDSRRQKVLFVDHGCGQWIVRDDAGRFWTLPAGDDPRARRQSFCPTSETELERVPGHYKDMLGLPS